MTETTGQKRPVNFGGQKATTEEMTAEEEKKEKELVPQDIFDFYSKIDRDDEDDAELEQQVGLGHKFDLYDSTREFSFLW